MQSAEQIIADIQELEKFHLSEEKMLNERCQVLADLHDKAIRELNEFTAHIKSCLLEFVTLAKRGIVRDRLIVNFYEKEFGDGVAAEKNGGGNEMSNEKQETIEDIVAAMRNEGHAGNASCLEWVSAKFTSYANRIEEAAKREREATREKPSQVGNAAEMREALEQISREILESIDPFCNGDCCKPKRELAKIADAALSAPPRNCDRPECATTKAAQEVWRKEDGGKTAYYEWLLQQYKEGESEVNR